MSKQPSKKQIDKAGKTIVDVSIRTFEDLYANKNISQEEIDKAFVILNN
ncbi:MAG: hypothetical protein HFE57_14050 [Firmicutes bacterium]|jgi:hypothetical protein|nr:hypothetical protein [Bacillota bacterium]